ncbi:unnamed protein product [Rotaria socialis]|uniref:Uncharacterized protein n=1 Tax=Rotaria socialis TaxID=392032 RepID=A0A817SW26_9BILA|nr:unnamed protein product [Rotaria socialis]
MTRTTESNLCSAYNKPSGKYFCPKDFKEHEQQLSIKFNNEVVRSHDELLDQIQKIEKPNQFSLDLFAQIEQWRRTTIENVEKVAERNSNSIQNGVTVAEGNGRGNRSDQLYCPAGVIIDNEKDSLIICDYVNDRVVRWSPQNGESGETIISNVRCWGLTMDDERNLYIVDFRAHDVRRYRMGENQGTVVAGGNGQGNRLDQLNNPRRNIRRSRSVSIRISNALVSRSSAEKHYH